MSENENDFEALRRLLTLKRHEIPPPGYFEDFSGNVIARIRAGAATRELPWLLRLLQVFESRPAFPVAFASSLCFLLLFGIVSIEQNPEVVNQPAILGLNGTGFPAVSPENSQAQGGYAQIFGNTNPPVNLSPNSTLFNSQPSPLFQKEQISFSTGGN